MKNNFRCKLSKLVVFSSFVFGFSMSSYASTAHTTKSYELKHTLSSSLTKQQFSFISNKINELRLPKSLALIPVIESHYNSRAVSPKGAGGLWQLMPGTAKEYGISSKDRFKLEASTVAALHYFNVLHKKFGNWEFAIAAYNAGSGRVQKALYKNPSATSVQQLKLPLETKLYVAKFIRMRGELQSYPA